MGILPVIDLIPYQFNGRIILRLKFGYNPYIWPYLLKIDFLKYSKDYRCFFMHNNESNLQKLSQTL
jgi:hypothetical protein